MKIMKIMALCLLIGFISMTVLGIKVLKVYFNTEQGEITQCYDKHNNPIIGLECEETNTGLLILGSMLIFGGMIFLPVVVKIWCMGDIV